MTSTPPAHPATARGLIVDQDARWLVAQRAGDDYWLLPGGLIEQDESPAAACRREVREELGLDLVPGSLYAVMWIPVRRPGRHARFSFIFHMGVHDADVLSARIRLERDELDAWQWLPSDEALGVLHPHVAERLVAARDMSPSAVYVEAFR